MTNVSIVSDSPESTFNFASEFAKDLRAGDAVMLSGGLGAGKTLFTKGMMQSLDFDIDEVTSPSFTLVNLYETERFNVYHIDLWRLDAASDVAFAVGLDEIIDDEKAVIIIEWSERLRGRSFTGRVYRVDISGDGDDPRRITVNGE